MNRTTRFTMLIAALAAALPTTARAQRDRDRTRIDTTFAFNKGGSVDVGIVSGEIVITGWTRPEAKVYATIGRGWLDASLSANRIRLQTRSDYGRLGEARYEISVPIGTRIRANAVSGSIRITGSDGEVDAESVSGDVEVIGASDRISIHSVTGRLHAARLRGRTRLGNTSSSIEAEILAPPLPMVNCIFLSRRPLDGISPGCSVMGNALEMRPLNVSSSRSADALSGISRCTLPECVENS